MISHFLVDNISSLAQLIEKIRELKSQQFLSEQYEDMNEGKTTKR